MEKTMKFVCACVLLGVSGMAIKAGLHVEAGALIIGSSILGSSIFGSR